MIEDISRQMFLESRKTKFNARSQNGVAFDVELLDVVDHRSTEGQEQFSLMFLGPGDAPTRQGMYSMTHSSLGEFDLFLVPIGRDDTGVSFEAVINRFPGKALA